MLRSTTPGPMGRGQLAPGSTECGIVEAMRTLPAISLLWMGSCATPADKPGSDEGGVDETGQVRDSDVSGETAESGSAMDSSDTGEPDPPEPFVLVVAVHPEDGALLEIDSNLPADISDCLAIPETGAPCADEDADDLVDAWEELVLQAVRPVLRMDEDEPFVTDEGGVLVQLGRVSPWDADTIWVPIVVAWSRDYGRCGLSDHNGDSERVVLLGERTISGLRITAAYTAAHEGEITDQGRIWEGDDLAELQVESWDGILRWVVFPSEGKHATFGTVAACESAHFLPCLEEDCAPDGVSEPADYDHLPEVANMGEPDHPFFAELSAMGLPGEEPWSDQRFCGGLDRDDPCSSPLSEKLTRFPF